MINEIKLFGLLILPSLLPPLVFIFGSFKTFMHKSCVCTCENSAYGRYLKFSGLHVLCRFYVDSGGVTFGTYYRRFCAQVTDGAIGHHHLSAWFRQRVFRLTKSQA